MLTRCCAIWRCSAPAAQGRSLQSIFLGGGTPSLFSPAALARLLEGVRGGARASRRRRGHARGQSGHHRARPLCRLSRRRHHPRIAGRAELRRRSSCSGWGASTAPPIRERAVEELHAAGLDEFQSGSDVWLAAADAGRGTGRHRAGSGAATGACVALPAHAGAGHGIRGPAAAGHARHRPQRRYAAGLPAAPGRRPAICSTRSRPMPGQGARCRHNLNYWQFGDYLGIGAGAHGKCSRVRARPAAGRAQRAAARAASLSGEPSGCEPAAADACSAAQVPAAELPFEYLLNALRLNEGFEQREFELRTGLPFGAGRRAAGAARSGAGSCDAARAALARERAGL